jgi:hypothetical protein
MVTLVVVASAPDFRTGKARPTMTSDLDRGRRGVEEEVVVGMSRRRRWPLLSGRTPRFRCSIDILKLPPRNIDVVLSNPSYSLTSSSSIVHGPLNNVA